MQAQVKLFGQVDLKTVLGGVILTAVTSFGSITWARYEANEDHRRRDEALVEDSKSAKTEQAKQRAIIEGLVNAVDRQADAVERLEKIVLKRR